MLGAKAVGAAALLDELRRRGAELLVLVSSTSSFLGAEGQAATSPPTPTSTRSPASATAYEWSR